MGFCIGGHLAFLGAATRDFRAAASFYGGGIATFTPSGGPATVTKAGGIRGRIVCFFGGQDPLIPADQVEQVRAALAEHQVRHEVVVYPEASHGFFCDQRGSYLASAAADAWTRTLQLFSDELT
jgi:carboxymethylenebutenolidase